MQSPSLNKIALLVFAVSMFIIELISRSVKKLPTIVLEDAGDNNFICRWVISGFLLSKATQRGDHWASSSVDQEICLYVESLLMISKASSYTLACCAAAFSLNCSSIGPNNDLILNYAVFLRVIEQIRVTYAGKTCIILWFCKKFLSTWGFPPACSLYLISAHLLQTLLFYQSHNFNWDDATLCPLCLL